MSWIPQAGRDGSWKVTLPCTKAEAEAIADEEATLAALDPAPTLMTSEPDESRPDEWQLDAYFEVEPDARALALIVALAPSAERAPAVTHIPEEDWVTVSQAGLEPIDAGRFHVRTPEHHGALPDGRIVFTIAAGRAFGTGHHQTTTGCLMMLDRLRARGHRFRDIADIGTGTGLLAFAALRLWPSARAIASDIDPIAIEVAAENAAANDVTLGSRPGRLKLVTAPGLDHRALGARAPYDLVIANILAGPLIELAPDFADALVPGGSLILAGLLDSQADRVLAACRRVGFRPVERITLGDWPTLHLVRRPARRGVRPAGLDDPGDWASDGGGDAV